MARAYTRSLVPVIDKRFQYKYTAIVIAIVVVVSGVLAYLLLESYWETNRIMNRAMGIPEIQGMLTGLDQTLNVFFVAITFVIMVVVLLGIFGLLITHRICGPLFVVHGHLCALLKSTYPHMRPLRAGDEFRSTYDTLKAVVEALKKRDEEEAEALTCLIASARTTGMPESDITLLQRFLDERNARVRIDAALPRQSPHVNVVARSG